METEWSLMLLGRYHHLVIGSQLCVNYGTLHEMFWYVLQSLLVFVIHLSMLCQLYFVTHTWLSILYIFVCWLAIGNLYSLKAPCCLLVPLVWIYYLSEWTYVFKCSFDQSVQSSFLFTTYVSSSAIVIGSRDIWYLQKHDIFFDKFDTCSSYWYICYVLFLLNLVEDGI